LAKPVKVKSRSITVSELFGVAELKPSAAFAWEDIPLIAERRCGIYVVAITPTSRGKVGKARILKLPAKEKDRWLDFQPIIYIGKTDRPISTRLKEFYRHKYENKSPHRGGQSRHLVQRIPQWYFLQIQRAPFAKSEF